MRRSELDYVLSTMLGLDRQSDTVTRRRTEVSDLNFTVDRPLQVEQNGELVPVACNPPIERLTPFQTEMVALNLINGNPRLTEDLIRTGSCDSSYSVADQLRFRVNIFSQRGKFSIVMRKLNTEIPSLTQMKLPDIFRQVVQEKTGLVLVTGATGSGKSTTLAAILNEINLTKSVHIITLEDPVEFVHPHKKATFNQREMGSDFSNFATGLRAALRQAPKVVLVGEMRDRETVEIGLAAAETGHLVLSTLHTIDAGQTINRVLGMFDPEEQEQVRIRLSDTLRWIISQRLAPKVGGGRYALLEIMGSNLRTKETIIQGESEGKSFYEIIESSHTFNWRNFDQACLEAYKENIITEETALNYCTKKGVVSRGIDKIKKERGEHLSSMDLKMKTDPVKSKTGSPIFPGTFKLK
ncbi:MAG TPA: PilT/PilU family type 4a pilus ATPase [Verrucomicrobiae bacterium]|jgi:twitching motility protein PilT|nr:PilT/PilU family type 4a pilus ATPase [Verrucomicrobiae bacterium]